LKDATLKQYLYDLDRRLDRIMAAVPAGEAGRKLHKRMRLHRPSLFVFVTRRDVPYRPELTNWPSGTHKGTKLERPGGPPAEVRQIRGAA